jgi:hypothetical protein
MSQSSEFCRHNPLRCFSSSVCCCKHIFRYRLSPETFWYTLVFTDYWQGSPSKYSPSSAFPLAQLCCYCWKHFGTGWTIGVVGFDYRWGLGTFLFTTASRTALGTTQPPIQWVRGALSLGIKGSGREADQSPQSNADVKNAWRFTSSSPILLHGMVLS